MGDCCWKRCGTLCYKFCRREWQAWAAGRGPCQGALAAAVPPFLPLPTDPQPSLSLAVDTLRGERVPRSRPPRLVRSWDRVALAGRWRPELPRVASRVRMGALLPAWDQGPQTVQGPVARPKRVGGQERNAVRTLQNSNSRGGGGPVRVAPEGPAPRAATWGRQLVPPPPSESSVAAQMCFDLRSSCGGGGDTAGLRPACSRALSPFGATDTSSRPARPPLVSHTEIRPLAIGTEPSFGGG